MIVIKDITELIHVEHAKSIEKLSDIMIASTSHDMRTPLNTIKSMLGLIENKNTDVQINKWIYVS